MAYLRAGGEDWVDLDRHAWQSVGLLAAELHDRGEILPLTDLEIAVAAHTTGPTLWAVDHHFERLTPLLDGLDCVSPTEPNRARGIR